MMYKSTSQTTYYDFLGQIAQLVEHGTENPGVVGSIPTLPTKSRMF